MKKGKKGKKGLATLAEHLADVPEDIQVMILMKLVKDRVSFIAFSFANKYNLQLVSRAEFWKVLMESEGRRPGGAELKLPKLQALFYQRLYPEDAAKVS